MSKSLSIKVCGLRNSDNILEVDKLKPDFCGFIFYPKSARFVGSDFVRSSLSEGVKSVAVLVKEDISNIERILKKNTYDYLQLHGDEDLNYIQEIKRAFPDQKLIKVFRVMDTLPNEMKDYEDLVDLFLFDTKVKDFGGSGHQFDWSIFEKVVINKPFLIAGGIGETDITELKRLKIKNLLGVDLNSKFEINPGLKDIKKLEHFIKELRNE